jgi:hypothetical protein
MDKNSVFILTKFSKSTLKLGQEVKIYQTLQRQICPYAQYWTYEVWTNVVDLMIEILIYTRTHTLTSRMEHLKMRGLPILYKD